MQYITIAKSMEYYCNTLPDPDPTFFSKKNGKIKNHKVDFFTFSQQDGFLDFVCDLGLRRKGAIRGPFPVV